MFRNYIKTAWRNLVRTPGYSALNILGLATGMAVALLIGLWVYDQYSFDKSIPDYERLYRVQRNFYSNGDTLTFRTTSLKLADELRIQIPEIEYVAESDWMGSHGMQVGDKKIYIMGGQPGSDFLKMFQFPFLYGNMNTAMKEPNSIVLTESTARSLFGDKNPMNQLVRYDDQQDLKVTGVLKNLPHNSSFNFNFLVPFSYFEKTHHYVKEQRAGSFGGNMFQIFVKLKAGVDYSQVAPKIRNIEHTEKGNTNAMYSYVTFQPLGRWHLYSNYVNGKDMAGFLDYVRIFILIGSLVLLIACINFINLTTARSEKRAREVGVRKAIGSQRKDLIIQFLSESFLLTCLAFGICLLFARIALPSFNSLTQSSITIPYSSLLFWTIMFSGVILTALIAGSRPAFYLSSFDPVKVLKGGLPAGKQASLPRKILVAVQFSCSIALIISTIIIYQQIQYAKERPSGYDLNRVLMTNRNGDLGKNYTALKNELIQKGIVAYVSSSSTRATEVDWHSDIDYWPGKNADETVEMGTVIVSEDYFETLGMKMSEGRNFVNEQDTSSVIFNQAAIKRLRLKNPINQIIKWGGQSFKIAGVVKDALMESPYSPADPTMFFINPGNQRILLYRLSPKIKTQEALEKLTAAFNKYNPGFPYSYLFADQEYAEKFQLEVLIGKLAGLFAALAIFICCLGLFGLAAYTAEQRTKEIGIRKVLGASVSQVWLLLSKDFLLLVAISCLVASPIAFYFLKNWLLKYDYRIEIGAGVFLISAAVALCITLITISFQSIRAAVANPVKSLRSE
jgi:putative ABC transport system permease protein